MKSLQTGSGGGGGRNCILFSWVLPWRAQQSTRHTLGTGEAASISVHSEDQAVIKGAHGEEGPPLLEVHYE